MQLIPPPKPSESVLIAVTLGALAGLIGIYGYLIHLLWFARDHVTH